MNLANMYKVAILLETIKGLLCNLFHIKIKCIFKYYLV